MIADALGWTLDRITDDIRPKIADGDVASEFLAVDPGYVCGHHPGRRRLSEAASRSSACIWRPTSARRRAYDAVEIEGSPRSVDEVRRRHSRRHRHRVDGRQLDPKVLTASPGLHTMRDLPLPSFFAGR